jgi:hypothetical protein
MIISLGAILNIDGNLETDDKLTVF